MLAMRFVGPVLVQLSLLVLLLSILVQADLDPSRVHLVAKSGRNLLFRGNLPIANGTFQYDDLMSLMEERAMAAGVDFPKENLLTVVSLNNVFDLPAAEKKFLTNNSKAELVNWPLGVAGVVPPTAFSEAIARKMAKSVWGRSRA